VVESLGGHPDQRTHEGKSEGMHHHQEGKVRQKKIHAPGRGVVELEREGSAG